MTAPDLFAAAIASHQRGQLADAERLYRSIVALDPRHAGALHYLGLVALQQGRNQEACDLIARSVAIHKRNPDACYHAGLACAALGRFADAVKQHQRAISLKSDYMPAHIGLGNALFALGRAREAASSYRRAIALAPQSAEAHVSLGDALVKSGNEADAIAAYERAIALNPNLVDALVARATLARKEGDAATAWRCLCRAMLAGANDEARRLFWECAEETGPLPDIPELRKFVIRAFDDGWTRPRGLAGLASRLLISPGSRAAPVLARFAHDPHAGTPVSAQDLASLAGDDLLRAYLEASPVSQVWLETAMRSARTALAAWGDAQPPDATMLVFACALARQCFVNEYLFDLDDTDRALKARALAALLTALAAGAQPSPMTVATVAAYQPLNAIQGADALLQRSSDPPMQGLLTQQLREPATERALRDRIPALTAIGDGVSQDVRDQYEQNPYPRWIKIARAQRCFRIANLIRTQLPDAPFVDVGFDNPRLLEAGCGTGQTINEVAQSIEGVQILAIDLSLASLAYAKRKTDELGLRNIEYAQADIAKLPETGRRFDIVQSGGVLHHMADPFAAWAGLVTMLKPGGLMRIALYSERARARIVAARDLIAAAGHPATPDGIREMRRQILRLPPDHPAAAIMRDIDFYSLSDCRDLVFHVQEHRLTLPQIADFIARNRLTFLGFDIPDTAVREAYRKRFPHDPAMTDLAAWDAFEADHPDTFRSMYEFWVQSPV